MMEIATHAGAFAAGSVVTAALVWIGDRWMARRISRRLSGSVNLPGGRASP